MKVSTLFADKSTRYLHYQYPPQGREKPMAINLKNLSDEQLESRFEEFQKELNRRRALATLLEHNEVKKVNQAIQMAAKETDTSEMDVRLAELKKYGDNLPTFYVEMCKTVEEWKKENATYRNPDNPDEYWYSPDGNGNPPKWIRDTVGSKPDRTKEKVKYEGWLKKLENYKTNGKST
jgi:hypothetical protein